MTINRMHSRLERKTEEFEVLKAKTLDKLTYHKKILDELIESIKSSRLYEIRDNVRHEVIHSVLGMNFGYFIDHETLLSIGFWSNGHHNKNLLAEIRRRIESKMMDHVGYQPSKRSPSGFTIEGSNDAEVYTIMWKIAVECLNEYEQYINRRINAYHEFFSDVRGWVYEEGNYTRDYDFFVANPKYGISEYIDQDTIGNVRPLTY